MQSTLSSDLLSSRQGGGKLVGLLPTSLLVPLPPLLHDELHHVLLVRDIDRRGGHEVVYDLRHEVNVSPRVPGDILREQVRSILELSQGIDQIS